MQGCPDQIDFDAVFALNPDLAPQDQNLMPPPKLVSQPYPRSLCPSLPPPCLPYPIAQSQFALPSLPPPSTPFTPPTVAPYKPHTSH
ncbi:hypothetical protein E2C01_036480 [Portunus trituberculatus]|uniref:Uncharacterized protein n=1 Tax=Portunus trituberculatus TaxID=210409 RepID=A0A5B7FC64_PORTR|nr:hypothetical protein [Portunus trituberculatus]